MAHFEDLEALFCGRQGNTIHYLFELYREPEKWTGQEEFQNRRD